MAQTTKARGGEPVSLAAALEAGKKVAPDVTGFLMDDHRTVLGWFIWYDRAPDATARRKVAARICAALRAHMAGEEEVFYPAARELVDNKDLVEHAFDEHAEARDLMERIEAASGDEEEQADLMRKLNAAVAHHAREEETKLFPAVRSAGMDLYGVGAALAARRVECLFELPSPETAGRRN